MGGGVSIEVQQKVDAIVQEENEKSEGEKLKLLTIPVEIKEKVGPEGLMEWLKEALAEEFGVVWSR